MTVNAKTRPIDMVGSDIDIIDSNQDIVEILKSKTFIDEVLTPQALLPGGDSRVDFGALMKADTVRWGEIIKATGIKPAL